MSSAAIARTALVLAGLFVPGAVLAQQPAPEEPEDDIWKLLEDIPARQAWDLGVGISFGNIGFWADKTTPWTGYSIRGTYGAVVDGVNRVGGSFGVSLEGPFPIYMTVAFEPLFAWDRVQNNIQVGASIGPALLLHSSQATIRPESYVQVAPVVSGRFGYSKAFSRLGRRFYVVVEPKVRYLVGGRNLSPRMDMAALLVVGSGRGR